MWKKALSDIVILLDSWIFLYAWTFLDISWAFLYALGTKWEVKKHFWIFIQKLNIVILNIVILKLTIYRFRVRVGVWVRVRVRVRVRNINLEGLLQFMSLTSEKWKSFYNSFLYEKRTVNSGIEHLSPWEKNHQLWNWTPIFQPAAQHLIH